MKNYPQFVAHYTCPKCRGRSCVTNEISLDSLPKKLVLRRDDQDFLLITCSLCGYTEMYSVKVLASQTEEAPAPQTSPAVEKLK